MPDIRELIEKYALQNAVKYGSAPKSGAVMGKLMGEHPELRKNAKEISQVIDSVLSDVAAMSSWDWETRLRTIAPDLLMELSEKKVPAKGLPELKGASGGVVMRFAPNPNGPPTIGSARGIIINSEYVKRYGGKFLIRFDDTDPVTKRPMLEAYDWYIEDCEWLGASPDKVVVASERLPLYYEVAEELIRRNAAYICGCDQTTFKRYKDAKEACPHRDQDPLESLDLWKGMLDGTLDEGEGVLRIKTDLLHKDPALRDWAAFRIVTKSHPRAGNRYRVWPLLDFESAVEDRLLGITHIIRGKDLMDSERRQGYLYRHMGWEYPITVHWGRVKIYQFGSFSTSTIRRAIEAGEYSGWDDPRLPTVRAFKRRGIHPQALRKFMVDLGVSETDISISLDNIYAENRKVVDIAANRRFFVKDPVLIKISGDVPEIVHPPLHPTSDRGSREIPAGSNVLISRADLEEMTMGQKIRLKDFCNVEILEMDPAHALSIGTDPATAKDMNLRIIHWAPVNGRCVRVLRPDGLDEGIGEDGIAEEVGRVVQFERYGFVRIESADDEILACYAHR